MIYHSRSVIALAKSAALCFATLSCCALCGVFFTDRKDVDRIVIEWPLTPALEREESRLEPCFAIEPVPGYDLASWCSRWRSGVHIADHSRFFAGTHQETAQEASNV